MTIHYEKMGAPRFAVETTDGYEQINIPARRNILVILFLSVWLTGWTVGGVSVIIVLVSKGFQPFLAIWLCGWALGEAYVAVTLCWLLFGLEAIRVLGADLEVGYLMLGFARRRLFRGSEIRHLSSSAPSVIERYNRISLPFFIRNKSGSVKFDYGARTIYLAAGLDESEGRLIVDFLRKRLPKTAAA
jgi:hypothetical protein